MSPRGLEPSFEDLVAILTDPATLRGDYLPEAERLEHERCTRSIVEARAYAEAHAHEWVIWR